MAQILLVGTATLDIVYTLSRYPAEDEEVRAQGLRVCRGGNAANSAVVLAQLGHRCSFMGVLADAPETMVIEQDFLRRGIDYSLCPKLSGRSPTSSIQLTSSSRTIVHYRDLPELTAERFITLDLAPFDWIHFEARNVPELLKMLVHVRSCRPELNISLELEKPREGVDQAFELASLLVCSRGFAASRGYDDPQAFLAWLQSRAPSSDVVAAWGEEGAFGLGRDGVSSHSRAYPPECVIDTLGAGDTFNAALIGALVNGAHLRHALKSACSLAGKKCGIAGFSFDPEDLADMQNK